MKNANFSVKRIIFEVFAFLFTVPPLLAIESPGWLAILVFAFVTFCAWRMPTVDLFITAALWIWGLIHILVNGTGHMVSPHNTYFPIFYYIGFGVYAIYFCIMLSKPDKYTIIMQKISDELIRVIVKHVPNITPQQYSVLYDFSPFYACAAIEHQLRVSGCSADKVRKIISLCNPANHNANRNFIMQATFERKMAIDALDYQGKEAYYMIATNLLATAEIHKVDCDDIDALTSDVHKILESRVLELLSE